MSDDADRSTSHATDASTGDKQPSLFPAWTAACTLVLLAVTWPLWLRTANTTFPQTPVFVGLIEVRQVVDFALSGLLGLGLLVAAVSSKMASMQRVALVLCCLLSLVLVSLDQQRLQPWIYHFGLVCLAVGTCRMAKAIKLCQFLVISIYVYSAIGKLDFEFLHSVGPNFVDVLMSWVGLRMDDLSESKQFYAALALPLSELLLAILLAVPQTRKLGARLACAFHLVLALVFSPFGLNHSLSVIVWNVQFAVQALLLFSERTASARTTSTDQVHPKSLAYFPTFTVFAFAIILPIGERFGMWDHWLSWALYAPHSSRAEVFVASSAVDRLPSNLQRLVRGPDLDAREATTLWLRVPVKQWCLESNFTPVYPQARSGVAAAWEIRRLLDTNFEVKVRLLSISNRFSGGRNTRNFVRPEEFKQLGDLYWINTLPRKSSAPQGGAQ